jgi:hypothetical protein
VELKINNFKDFRINPRIVAATVLLLASLLAALAISSNANRSVLVWSANNQLNAGTVISALDIKKTKVFLPENSKLYYSDRAHLIGSTILRAVGVNELIPVAAITNEKSPASKKSVPIKVSRNDYPSTLSAGMNIDIYALPIRDTSTKGEAVEIAKSVSIESLDLKNKDIGGEIGIVVKLKNEDINDFLTGTLNSRLVVVQSAF